jgi:uncharacterized heparinase superfamily protein
MPLKDLPRLARTVAHLRPSQIYWRGRYALRRRSPFRSGGQSTLIGPAECLGESLCRAQEQDFAWAPRAESAADELAIVQRLSQGVFRHLNEERQLGRPAEWALGPCDRGRLWTVTLHYHRWAWELAMIAGAQGLHAARAYELFRELVGDWIERCDLSRPGARHLAWNSYAIATRIQWWTLAALQLGTKWGADPQFEAAFCQSLSRQTDHLARNIEWDLRGNHLVRDGVGLAFAGRLLTFLNHPNAKRYLRTATRLAADQAEEQVLRDGGHFERSPMYHAHVMHDFAMLAEMSDDAGVRERLLAVVDRMDEFATWMRHPDGGLVLFNDAALDEEPPPLHTVRPRFATEPHGGRHFGETGFVVWRGTKWDLFFDVGPIGPDYQPGHGHADNLTIECSYAGQRLFVDPGTHSYDRDERRKYDRSTAAHNTVCVEAIDSSEVWHIFRVGRRARPIDVHVHVDATHFDASAAHDGYAHLGDVIHRRRVRLADDEILSVTDGLTGRGPHQLEGGWLLAPGWTAKPAASGWLLSREDQSSSLTVSLNGSEDLRLDIETRSWHPRFGVEIPTTRLVWRWEGSLPFELTTTVAPG